jgi:chromosome segregation ATPase
MFGLPLGIVVETFVAILLATTIGYCVILNQRLKRLHADRGELRQMVADLVQATGLANTAIQELKNTAQDAETNLSNRLNEAERFGVELASHVNAGQQLIDRLARITSAARAPANEFTGHRSATPATQAEDDRLEPEPNKVQSALQQLSMRPRIRGNAA